MKRIITPFIHLTFLIPLTGITVAGLMLIERTYGFQLDLTGLIEGSLIIIIFGIPLFMLANRLMQGPEKLLSPSILDHLRQSLFFYLIIIYSLSTWIFEGFSDSESNGYLLLWSGGSLVAIVVNCIFLFRKHKTNV